MVASWRENSTWKCKISLRRSLDFEIIESRELTHETLTEVHRALTLTHRILGTHRYVIRLIKSAKAERVLDLGCGKGDLLVAIRSATGAQVVGVDIAGLTARPGCTAFVLNAVHDPLPEADVATALFLTHHLSEEDVIRLIQNVRRTCRRLIVVDLVRHRLPLVLFRVFLAPWLPPINAADGATSIRRAFTFEEFQALVERALAGTRSRVKSHMGWAKTRMVFDMEFLE